MMRLPKSGLMAGCALGAVGIVLAQPAHAQAFNGVPATQAGSVTYNRATPGVETITVNSPSAVILWNAADPAQFLPNGNVATYQGAPSNANFTVLNRISPNGPPIPVTFNGTVRGFTDAGQTAVGGNILFYGPNGIIAGPTSVFTVGSLTLTTNDILFEATGSLGPQVRFRGAAGSTTSVVIQPGAQLNASGTNAYIALVAPRVVQGGTLNADGQVALIGAEQVDMTVSGGLFDFTITVGTTDANGIVHTGDTTGPTSTGSLDFQQISMVALPKNDALTMLLSGSVGYTPATVGGSDGGTIVLTAGSTKALPTTLPTNRLASIEIGNATFRNPVTADASNAIRIAPTGGTTAFAGNASFFGLNSVDATAGAGEQITVGRDLLLYSGVPGTGGTSTLQALGTGRVTVANQLGLNASSTVGDRFGSGSTGPATGGVVTINADGGTISAIEAFIFASAQTSFANAGNGPSATGGEISLIARNGGSYAVDNFSSLNVSGSGEQSLLRGGDGFGGSIDVIADGGTIAMNFLGLSAGGNGGNGGSGGTGTGGTIDVLVSGGGTIRAQSLNASAFGAGGPATLDPGSRGNGVGGAVTLTDSGGLLDLATVGLSANANGGGLGRSGGDATGGTVLIEIGSTQTWQSLAASANAQGGPAGTEAQAGNARADADAVTLRITGAGNLTVTSDVQLSATASAAPGGGANSAVAGGIAVEVSDGGLLDAPAFFRADATAFLFLAGEGVVEPFFSSPSLQGGRVSVIADNGIINLGSFDALANAHGIGSGGPAGSAGPVTGGTAIVGAINGGRINATDANLVRISAEASGGNDVVPTHAQGGTATLYADGGLIDFEGDTRVSADAFAGTTNDGPGITATGGTASVELRAGTGGTGAMAFAALEITAAGTANERGSEAQAVRGNGNTGTGGTARLVVGTGAFSAAEAVVSAEGVGGSSEPGEFTLRTSGNGRGGTAEVRLTGGTSAFDELRIEAEGYGGGAFGIAREDEVPSIAGNGTGGTATLALAGGSLTADASLIVRARGHGGRGTDIDNGVPTAAGGPGGDGIGGTAAVQSTAGSGGLLVAPTLLVQADGLGGDGGAGRTMTGVPGDGGDGTGGSATAALGDKRFTLGAVTVEANGLGGNGAAGGNGTGGAAGFAVQDTLSSALPRTLGPLTLRANGTGGTNSGTGGVGRAGSTSLAIATLSPGNAVTVGGNLLAQATGAPGAPGNGFTGTITGQAFRTTGSTTIAAPRDVVITIAPGSSFTSGTAMSIESGGSVTATGPLVSAGAMTIRGADDVSLQSVDTSGGELTLEATNGALAVTGDINGVFARLASQDGVTVGGEIHSGGNLFVDTRGAFLVTGDVFSGDGNVTADGGITMGAFETGEITRFAAVNGDIVVADLRTSGSVYATGQDIDIFSSGGLNVVEAVATAGDAVINASNRLVVGTASATGAAELESFFADLLVQDQVTGGSIDLRARDGIEIQGDLTAADTLSATTRFETFSLAGTATGRSITITSPDIDLNSESALGVRGTTRDLTIVNIGNPNRPMIVGGEASTLGYSLDQAELTRIYADQSITIRYDAGEASPDQLAPLSIDDFALSFGANGQIGTGGTLEISSPGVVAVAGAVALTTSGPNDRFLIDPTRVHLNTQIGSIALLDSAGVPTGRLEIVGDTIVAATGAVLEQVRTLTDFAAIKAALDAPGGTLALRAGSIAFRPFVGLYIQNTGASTAFADRRGFLANALSIQTEGSQTRLAINGQLVTANGTISGLGVTPLVTINGAPAATGGAFDPGSTVNGCAIGSNCAVVVPPPPPPPPPPPSPPPPPPAREVDPPNNEELTAPTRAGDIAGPLFLAPLVEIAGSQPLITPPLVDEPITGVGNDDLWQTPCEGGEDGTCAIGEGSR